MVKLTKGQKDTIGEVFPHNGGGEYAVKGVTLLEDGSLKKSGTACYFDGECSVCGEVVSNLKGGFKRGACSCSCSSREKAEDTIGSTFKHNQGGGYTITGLTLLEDGSIKKSGSHVYFDGECSVCGEVVSNKKVNFKRGDCSCSCSPKEKAEDTVGRTYSTTKGGTLTVEGIHSRIKGGKGTAVFNLSCSICSLDIELSPEGSITSIKSSLDRGHAPCGCSDKPNWSKEQYMVKIQRECLEREYTFKGFVGDWKGKNTYLRLYNPVTGNTWGTTTIDSFLNGGCGDPMAVDNGVGNGYYPERTQEEDYLYVVCFDNQYLKVGRSFRPEERLKELKSQSGINNLKLLHLLKATHQEIYDCEQEVHQELTQRGFYHHDSDWSQETFDRDSEQVVYRLLDEYGFEECDLICKG
ncbi:meiotically up-regulated protein 113 [Vibrio phage 1.170.O._10N.261.52.C3]|nr:meiotically up-regulated protein 113 [Vibrio phage 1.170.O._10N.261.52.C3]